MINLTPESDIAIDHVLFVTTLINNNVTDDCMFYIVN